MVGALLKNGATASGLLRATGIVGVGGTAVFAGGTLVDDGWGNKVQVAVGGKAVLPVTAVLMIMAVAVDKVDGVSVTGGKMVGLKTVVCVKLAVGNTNGVGDLMGRLQATRTKITTIPSA